VNFVLTLNPRVREIFDAAVRAAQPVWLAVTRDGAEVTERVQVLFEPVDMEYYTNVHELHFLSDKPLDVNGAVLAKTKTSAPFIDGPLDHARQLGRGDTLVFAVASIHVHGPATKEFSS
jgi:hypothetical protein